MLRRSKQTNRAPVGLAFDHRHGEIVIADFSPDGQSYDVYRKATDERRSVNIDTTDLRTTLLGGNAHTQQLKGVVAEDTDETILHALAAQAANSPYAAFGFSRSPDGRVLLTQVDRNAINEVDSLINEWYVEQQPELTRAPQPSLTIETRTRAIARVWSLSTQHQQSVLAGTTALLVLGRDDYSFGLWSASAGLVYETEENFEGGATLEDKCEHAGNGLCRLITPSTLEGLSLSPVDQVIVSAPDDTIAPLIETLQANSELHGLHIAQISLDLGRDEPNILDQPTALAIGAIMAAGNHHNVPVCNLTLSPEDRLETLKQETEKQARAARAGLATRGAVAVLAPLVAIIAFMLTCMADQAIERARLESRIEVEKQISEKLAKENADYESQKVNFNAFNSLNNYLLALRTRQPAALQLLRDLNQRWPSDQSWYISELNVKGGSIEIKGKTKNEQSITTFAKALEFSDGLFTNILTKTNAQGTTPNPMQNTAAPASSVVEFNILATYAPLASPGKQVAPSTPSDPMQPKPNATPNLPPPPFLPPQPPMQPGMSRPATDQPGLKPPVNQPANPGTN